MDSRQRSLSVMKVGFVTDKRICHEFMILKTHPDFQP